MHLTHFIAFALFIGGVCPTCERDVQICALSLRYPGVAWFSHDSIHVKFHLGPRSDELTTPRASLRVRHVIMRLREHNSRRGGLERNFVGDIASVREIDRWFSQLPHLETLMLETQDVTQTNGIAEAMTHTRERLRLRACREALQLAKDQVDGR